MDALMAARNQLKEVAAKFGVAKFTLMPMMLKATSLALAEFPELNSSVSEDGTQVAISLALTLIITQLFVGIRGWESGGWVT